MLASNAAIDQIQSPAPDDEDQRKLLKGIGVTEIRDEINRLRQDAIDFSEKLEHLLAKADFNVDPDNIYFKTYRGEKGNTRNGELPEKEFRLRNSPLTDLFKSKHFQSLENAFISALFLWAVCSAIVDLFEKRTIWAVLPNLGLVESAFSNAMQAFLCWLKIFGMVMAIHPLAGYWAKHRRSGPKITLFDRIFLFGYFIYLCVVLLIPFRILFKETILGRAAAIALAMEHIRLMMKLHAFVREMSKRFLRDPALAESTKKSDGDSQSPSPTSKQPLTLQFPNFGTYLYFLFVPTFVYRDVYPRTHSTDWYYVFSNFAQVCACCMLTYYILQRGLLPRFANFNAKTITFTMLAQTTSNCILPGTACVLMCFFGLLHSWLNAWAEMLRFGDRLFYKDWWNVDNYMEYWRSWNTVVHDWLYTYVYKDVQEVLKIRSKRLASLCVFACSAFFHEYIVIVMLRSFFPLLLFNFLIFGQMFTLIPTKGRIFNIFMWASLTFGNSLMVSLYTFEMEAHEQCPPIYESHLLNTIVPRLWACMH